ncbi:MAG: hypothetical protein R8P61_23085 [Bacteroidia bacterium]|nr:hypothetical protein [Bacteroidia bacterium]
METTDYPFALRKRALFLIKGLSAKSAIPAKRSVIDSTTITQQSPDQSPYRKTPYPTFSRQVTLYSLSLSKGLLVPLKKSNTSSLN